MVRAPLAGRRIPPLSRLRPVQRMAFSFSDPPAPAQGHIRRLASAWPRLLYGCVLLVAVAPLWVSVDLPLVDMPQHLHLISVLHRLDDPNTLYPELFAARRALTPYLGYYYPVHLLTWVVPLETANRLFLSAYVLGMPLSLAFLLRCFGRQTWPSLLALPLAYGDSFAWGFINFIAALPLTFLTLGLFLRAIETPAVSRRRSSATWMGLALVAVLVLHIQAFGFLAFALPWLLFTARGPGSGEGWKRWLGDRRAALLGVIPGVLLFLAWLAVRPSEALAVIEPGAPWKAWGSTFSSENMRFASGEAQLLALPGRMVGLLRDGRDAQLLWGVIALILFALVASRLPPFRAAATSSPPGELRRRLAARGLPVIAFALYFLTPFDIHGLVYYLSPRFAHFAGPLLVVAAVPRLNVRGQQLGLLGAAVLVTVMSVVVGRGFVAFDREAAPIRELAPLAGPKPLVMGLIHDRGSEVMRLPVHLHAAATVARLTGGAPNFSFASTPHSPLRYRDEAPPTFPSEWRPQQFRFTRHGRAYDAFLLRGSSPARVFGAHLGRRVEIVGQRDGLWLLRKR